ncbi:ArdC-like ssDNA-binding domain-containing protein [Agromyces humi]|uniref:ArdC-like ssDNA-binding domain-containing protein n=1 Tax=Agromyces humi TaxID=1766800 RepID=UPI00135B97F1|nr:ArdC-like ssDNA-binding domain-containing protein [Agromyces humi]
MATNNAPTALVDLNGDHHSGDGKYTEHTLSAADVVLGDGDGAKSARDQARSEASARNQEQAKEFLKELEGAVANLDKDENWTRYLDAMSKLPRYSLNNQLIIMGQMPGATRVASFNTWKKLGRNVKAGEKSLRILAPGKRWYADREDEKGEKVKVSGVASWTTVGVFDISQTEGDPLPLPYEQLSEEPPEGFIENLESSIRDAGFTVSYEEIAGGSQGFTDGKDMRVVVDSRLNPAERASVLAHERGHIACGHLDRVGEYHTGKGGCRGAMEVEAESFAYTMCRANGMSTQLKGAASTYVKGWSRTEPEALSKAADKVREAFASVMKEKQFLVADLDESITAAKSTTRRPARKSTRKTTTRTTRARRAA